MTTERSSMSRSLYKNRDLEKLEPYEGKLSRTVLRGEEGSNALDLPDRGAYVLRVVILLKMKQLRMKLLLANMRQLMQWP